MYVLYQCPNGIVLITCFLLLSIFGVRCRKGSAEILVNLDDLYPPVIGTNNKESGITENATTTLGSFQICGKDVPRGYWVGVFLYRFL